MMPGQGMNTSPPPMGGMYYQQQNPMMRQMDNSNMNRMFGQQNSQTNYSGMGPNKY